MPRLVPGCAAALVLLLAALPAAALAEEGDDVLKLFDEFVSSGAVASHCASPSNQLAIRFLSNFQWISTHATREIGRRSPGLSGEQVAGELARRSREVKDGAHAMVKAHGCDSMPVQQMVQRFIAQSTWVREGA
jgi:hypothetical protein